MRTETYTRTFAKFDELTKEQQAKVLDNLRDINVNFNGWHDGVQDDFINILELLGFYDIKTFFSGFWSQGDGASFSAKFTVPQTKKELKTRLKALNEHAPTYFKETGLDKDFLTLDFSYALENEESYEVIKQNGRYVHQNTMYCDNVGLQEFARHLAAKYYIDLDADYEYLTSDEAVKETIESNDYEFDLDSFTIA